MFRRVGPIDFWAEFPSGSGQRRSALIPLLPQQSLNLSLIIALTHQPHVSGSDPAGPIDEKRGWQRLDAAVPRSNIGIADHHTIVDVLPSDKGLDHFPAVFVTGDAQPYQTT